VGARSLEVLMDTNRTKKIQIRVSEMEYARIKKTAGLAGLKLDPFIRRVLLGIKLKPRRTEEVHALIRQISGAANNVNQIARRVNTNGRAEKADVKEALDLVKQIWERVEKI
jgi:hypothetical protein